MDILILILLILIDYKLILAFIMDSEKKKIMHELAVLRNSKVNENLFAKINHSFDPNIKKELLSKRQSDSLTKKPKSYMKVSADHQDKIKQYSEDEKSTNSPTKTKRKFSQNYQLPKIDSPLKPKNEVKINRYLQEGIQDLLDEETSIKQMNSIKKSKQKGKHHLSATVQLNPKNNVKLKPLHHESNKYIKAVFKTRAGLNGKIPKINQDIAIIDMKLPHGVKIFCVCDGHGTNGHLVSAFIKTNLLKHLNLNLKKLHSEPEDRELQQLIYFCMSKTNEQLLASEIGTQLSGSTVVLVCIFKEKILTFNVGDSRAILIKQIETGINLNHSVSPQLPKLSHVYEKEKYEFKIVELSIDQKPQRTDERERILKNGGRVYRQKGQMGEQVGPLRVWMKDIAMPGLAMTRSFGDKAGIRAGTNGQPQITENQLTAEDKFIIIASDGVWEYMLNEEVMKFAIPFYAKGDLDGAAENIVKKAGEAWAKMSYSRDDITVIVVALKQAEK